VFTMGRILVLVLLTFSAISVLAGNGAQAWN